jgi:hypothetical protein
LSCISMSRIQYTGQTTGLDFHLAGKSPNRSPANWTAMRSMTVREPALYYQPFAKGIRIATRQRLVPTNNPAQGGVQRRLDASADRFPDECDDLCLFGRGQLL